MDINKAMQIWQEYMDLLYADERISETERKELEEAYLVIAKELRKHE